MGESRTILYQVLNETLEVNEEVVSTYGIKCIVNGKSKKEFDDVSTNKEKVESFVEACNTLQLNPEYLQNVLEDYISKI